MEAAGPGHWNGSGPQKSKKETRSECRVRHSAARIKPPNGDAEIEVVCLHLDHVSETTRFPGGESFEDVVEREGLGPNLPAPVIPAPPPARAVRRDGQVAGGEGGGGKCDFCVFSAGS